MEFDPLPCLGFGRSPAVAHHHFVAFGKNILHLHSQIRPSFVSGFHHVPAASGLALRSLFVARRCRAGNHHLSGDRDLLRQGFAVMAEAMMMILISEEQGSVTYSVPSTERLLNANVSRDCHRRVLPGKRHSGRTLYAKAQSEPYAREENTTAAGLPAT